MEKIFSRNEIEKIYLKNFFIKVKPWIGILQGVVS